MSDRLIRLLIIVVAVACGWREVNVGGEEPPANVQSPQLSIYGGGYLFGSPVAPTGKGRMAWQSPLFSNALEYPLDAVASIRFVKQAAIASREGDLAFEFMGGDIVVGKLKSLSDAEVVIDAAELGEVKVKRGFLAAIYRTKGESNSALDGPGELRSWTTPPKSDGWSESEDGGLASKSKFARLWRTVEVPEMAKLELELSWRQKGAFSFEVTKEGKKPAIRNGISQEVARPPSFRVEIAGGQLLAAREAEKIADVAPIQDVPPGEGQTHLLLYIDQKKGVMSVCRPSGEQLAKVEAAPTGTESLNMLRFSSGEGDLRIVSLRLAPWSGVQPAASKSDTAMVTLKGGEDVTAQVEGFDSEKRAWQFKIDGQSKSMSESEINEIRFAPSEAALETTAKLAFRNGSLLNGACTAIGAEAITIASPLMSQEVTANYDKLLAFYQRTTPTPKDEPTQRLGRFDASGFSLKGWLVNHTPKAGPVVIGWRPKFGLNDVAISPELSGQIVYRELPPPPSLVPEKTYPRAPAVRVRSSSGASTIGQASTAKGGKTFLYLRTGDMVQGDVMNIDERGVTFRSEETKATFIANKEIRAVELATNVTPIGIPKAKKDRLLMLPRSQRESPPTHLVRSVRGDYLRCRIVSMDENNLDAEVRLEAKRIPRNTIARIIWLHPEEALAAAKGAEKDKGKEDAEESKVEEQKKDAPQHALQFQAIPESRKRLTFTPQRVAANLLVGQSTILGECNIDLDTTSVVLIGSAIENSGIPLAYDQWKLRPAPEPIAASETSGDEGGGSDGLESILVGKPAPEIDLTMLDGKKFTLANHKNKVVILDFWASWCGPCIQAMPQIHLVAEEFAADGVDLVGINLEEAPERVSATLKRLELDMPVALDRDGRIAGKYGATAIPQTVIIDAEGKVARVFVGGGSRFADQLRQALRTVLGKPNPADAAQ